jgi:hypothetical protein
MDSGFKIDMFTTLKINEKNMEKAASINKIKKIKINCKIKEKKIKHGM